MRQVNTAAKDKRMSRQVREWREREGGGERTGEVAVEVLRRGRDKNVLHAFRSETFLSTRKLQRQPVACHGVCKRVYSLRVCVFGRSVCVMECVCWCVFCCVCVCVGVCGLTIISFVVHKTFASALHL